MILLSTAQTFGTPEYDEERVRPKRGERFYLHLADLRIALDQVKRHGPLRILDYGCGGSPYRELFPDTQYKRADFMASRDLDYKLAEDSRLSEENCTFDFILSTQVLEHVKNPAVYLAECHRLLQPGGELALTTHGVFEDHGCPHDFHRWTADGLRQALEASGFRVVYLQKLTTGPRAVVFLREQFVSSFIASRRTIFGMSLWLLRKAVSKHKKYVHFHCDKAFSANRLADAKQDGHTLYIGLLALCRKESS